MSLNVRVREIRKYLRLTQVEFSSKLGLKQGSIADWERGKSTPSIETLTNIADNFNINLHWLLTGKGEMFLSDKKEPQEKRVDNNELINLRRRYDQLEKVCNDLKKSIEESEKECSILSNKNQELNQELFTRLRELLECKDLIIKLQKNNC
jgi:transcriptional regulator with XRE-family HTH domain